VVKVTAEDPEMEPVVLMEETTPETVVCAETIPNVAFVPVAFIVRQEFFAAGVTWPEGIYGVGVVPFVETVSDRGGETFVAGAGWVVFMPIGWLATDADELNAGI
jgi:hypothetical protein